MFNAEHQASGNGKMAAKKMYRPKFIFLIKGCYS
jgi:hypothetical protein